MSDGPERARPEEYFRVLVQQAVDGIFIANRDGVYLEVNPSGHKMLGYAPGELIGRRVAEIVRPSDLPKLGASFEELLHGGAHTLEWILVRKDGSPIEVEVTAQPLSDGSLMAIVRDLGPRRAIERQVRESETRLRSILLTAPDVIMAVDRNGTILFINRTTPPYTPAQVVGTSCFDYVPAESRGRVEAALDTVFSTQTLDEYEVKGPSGWVSVRAGPLIEGDRVVAAILCATNIDARKETERITAELEEQLRQSQKVESIGTLAGGVAHDFNNLLTSIMGFADLARAELPPGSRGIGYLANVQQAAERGAELTQQLLAFARKRIVRPQVVNLNETLQRMAALLRPAVGENIEIALGLTADVGMVKVDPGSIEQVIVNLMVNARDAIRGAGRITLVTQNATFDAEYCRRHLELTPGDYVMMGISDTGVGMAPEIRTRIFEPFFTTKPAGSGTGLGLAMCHGIVKQAGGHIAVESEPGAGTTFRVFLPRSVESLPLEAPPTSRTEPPRGHETILLVEDEPMILRVASTALHALGYRVLVASDGVRALELVQGTNDPVDLLITDVVMPHMDGRELVQRLSELRPGIRILFSSGYAENSIVEHGVVPAGIEFLAKPYTPTTLAKRVREVLDK